MVAVELGQHRRAPNVEGFRLVADCLMWCSYCSRIVETASRRYLMEHTPLYGTLVS